VSLVASGSSNSNSNGSNYLESNASALSSSSNGNGVKRLKQVSCTCTNGKSGTTLKCRVDGDLEQCTPTQQGSNACYKVGFSGLKLC